VLDGVAVRIHKVFQRHPSLKNKIICRIISQDLAIKNPHVTCGQMVKAIRHVAEDLDDAVYPKNILEPVVFEVRMVECMKNDPAAYGTLKELETRFSKHPLGTEMQNLNRLLTKAKAEILREVNIVLMTCGIAGNEFFHENFSADFVVVETIPCSLFQLTRSRRRLRLSTQRLPFLSALRS
jgi:hypothetical protein